MSIYSLMSLALLNQRDLRPYEEGLSVKELFFQASRQVSIINKFTCYSDFFLVLRQQKPVCS